MEKFYADCLSNLEELHDDIKVSLDGLSPEALDWSPKEGVNSIGSLIVHLNGAYRFLFGQVISGQNITRDRDAEFRAKRLTTDELVKRMDDGLAYVSGMLEGLTSADLERTCKFRKGEATVEWVVIHAVKHTASHLGHIQVMRDMWLHFKA